MPGRGGDHAGRGVHGLGGVEALEGGAERGLARPDVVAEREVVGVDHDDHHHRDSEEKDQGDEQREEPHEPARLGLLGRGDGFRRWRWRRWGLGRRGRRLGVGHARGTLFGFVAAGPSA